MRMATAVLSMMISCAPVILAQSSPAQPAPGSVPVTSQTPAATNGSATTGGVANPQAADGGTMTKDQRKQQRRDQKQQEKSAKEQAKAAKANAKAVKAQNQATDAAEKAQQPK